MNATDTPSMNASKQSGITPAGACGSTATTKLSRFSRAIPFERTRRRLRPKMGPADPHGHRCADAPLSLAIRRQPQDRVRASVDIPVEFEKLPLNELFELLDVSDKAGRERAAGGGFQGCRNAEQHTLRPIAKRRQAVIDTSRRALRQQRQQPLARS